MLMGLAILYLGPAIALDENILYLVVGRYKENNSGLKVQLQSIATEFNTGTSCFP